MRQHTYQTCQTVTDSQHAGAMSKLLIAILQPTGAHSHYVAPAAANQIVEKGKGFAVRKRGVLIAVRMRAVVMRDDATMLKLDRGSRSALAGTPVIRASEMLAPSPRHHFGFKQAVYADMRTSPQRLRADDMRSARKRWNQAKVASE